MHETNTTMTTRAEEIAAEIYPDDAFRKADRATKDFPSGPYPGHETELRRAAFINGYKQGQQDRWIPVSQFKAPAPGQTILFGSKNTVRMWTWDANNDEPPSSWATHYRLIELPPNPDQP